MATRAERFHADEQRTTEDTATAQQNKSRSRPGAPPAKRTRAKKHAEKKASYALETGDGGSRPSRKSTRKSANRSKPDANLNLREALQKGSPEARFRKERARRTRVRASTPST